MNMLKTFYTMRVLHTRDSENPRWGTNERWKTLILRKRCKKNLRLMCKGILENKLLTLSNIHVHPLYVTSQLKGTFTG